MDEPDRAAAPPIPDGIVAADLDRSARGRLRTLAKDNADEVARHLVAAGQFLEDDPERAYGHAQEAVRRAGRVDVVREAAGITAYRTGRYAEALRELRTARRLNGSNEHVPLMADCERGLGRPERALALADEHAGELTRDAEVELAMVVSGARLDLEQPEAALAALSSLATRSATGTLGWRVAEARVEALRACERVDEAEALLASIPDEALGLEEEDVVVMDLAEEFGVDAEEPETDEGAGADERADAEDLGPDPEGAADDGAGAHGDATTAYPTGADEGEAAERPEVDR